MPQRSPSPGTRARAAAPSPRRKRLPSPPVASSSPVTLRVRREEWLRLIEERFRNALVADMIAVTLGIRAQQTAEGALIVADQYMARIREPARRVAAAAIASGDWTIYADLLPEFLKVLAPCRVPRPRGRPARTPGPNILAALRRYDEILLGFQSGREARNLVRDYARDLSDDEVRALCSQSNFHVAAELAVRGTNIRAQTLIHRYAPRQKVGRLHTIANQLGMWTRSGKRRRSYRFTEGQPPGLEERPRSD